MASNIPLALLPVVNGELLKGDCVEVSGGAGAPESPVVDCCCAEAEFEEFKTDAKGLPAN